MPGRDRFWVIVPAAGSGSRMNTTIPKQYQQFAQRPLIAHTLARLDRVSRIDSILVCLDQNDQHWPALNLSSFSKPIKTVDGGDSRAASVLNGLHWLQSNTNIHDEDFVLVHDAARPCVTCAEIDSLIDACQQHAVGGLLGLPVVDTLKSVSENSEVQSTVDRSQLWRALTPQMFRFGRLFQALTQSMENYFPVTDEASAIEQMGWSPKMVRGRSTNMKLTYSEDTPLIEHYLRETENR